MAIKRGPVAEKLVTELFQPEVLREKVPRMDEVQDGAAYMKSMANEIESVGKYRRVFGDRMHLISKIDSTILKTLEELHEAECDCGRPIMGSGGHKEYFYDWLNTYGQTYDVRGTVIV